MAIVGDYTAQQMRNLILKFYPGTYSPTKLENVVLNWETRTTYSSMGNIGAAITAVENGPYQNSTYTYLKYCEEYIIGYGGYNIQILKGRCYYGGIRDLGTFIEGVRKITYSGMVDLPAAYGRVFAVNLSAAIRGFAYGDLPAFFRGVIERNLAAYIRAMSYVDLPADIAGLPPADLSAYIKPWPMKQLPANIYGWDIKDLSGALYAIQKGDLSATIGATGPRNLRVLLKGWAREVQANLGLSIRGFTFYDLPTTIRATYLKDLPGYLYAVAPQDITASIHGWQTLDLAAILTGVYGDYDLQASYLATYNFKNLGAIFKSAIATQVPYDLLARIKGYQTLDLKLYVEAIAAINLAASWNPIGNIRDLNALIVAKTIRLTSVLDVITMSHADLYGVINACFSSQIRDLAAYIRTVYKLDLGAVFIGKKYDTTIKNLPSKIGYADTYSYIDKLPLNITISTDSYRFINMLPIIIKIFKQDYNLGATIVGTYLYNNLPATVTGTWLEPHHFANTKNKERFYNRTYAGVKESLQLVELSFSSIVEEYLYSDVGTSAWKANKEDKWILDISSYIPQNISINVKRKLHKFKLLSDISRYVSVDDAVRAAIDYVTSYPVADISASIGSRGGFLNLSAQWT
jgi:hypothetical protein